MALLGPALGQTRPAGDFRDGSELAFPLPPPDAARSHAGLAPRQIAHSGPTLAIPAVASGQHSVYGKLSSVFD